MNVTNVTYVCKACGKKETFIGGLPSHRLNHRRMVGGTCDGALVEEVKGPEEKAAELEARAKKESDNGFQVVANRLRNEAARIRRKARSPR